MGFGDVSAFLGPCGFHVTTKESHTPFDPRGVGGYKRNGKMEEEMSTRRTVNFAGKLCKSRWGEFLPPREMLLGESSEYY